jgi:hypothetical protein
MSARVRSRKSDLEDAREALDAMSTPIRRGVMEGSTVGDDEVEGGLDAMASALAAYKGLDTFATPLDQILAKMRVDSGLVEAAAELIEALGQATYAGGIEDVGTAERLRRELCRGLEDLLDELEDELSVEEEIER